MALDIPISRVILSSEVLHLDGGIMLTTSLTSKGQVTIPVQLRTALGLNPGDQIDFEQSGDSLILKRHTNNIQACFGLLKADRGVSLEEMDTAKQQGALREYNRH